MCLPAAAAACIPNLNHALVVLSLSSAHCTPAEGPARAAAGLLSALRPGRWLQNITKKSKGFNWGPSAVSTTYWTGVRLCDLLRYCGVRRPSQGAKHVLFAGIEKELPQVSLSLLENSG